MKINDFREKSLNKQSEMDTALNAFKLENVLSLWYFVRSKSKSTIVGSKD